MQASVPRLQRAVGLGVVVLLWIGAAGCPSFPESLLHYDRGVTGDGGCVDGRCCSDEDRDKDGFSECAGDCDDSTDRISPRQGEFFASSINGRFDVNCDGRDEPEFPHNANCVEQGADCAGHGWADGEKVPACGAEGRFTDCRRTGVNKCTKSSPSVTRLQRCR